MMLNGQFPCYRVYRTKDDKHITIGALEEKFWQNLCRALEREDLTPHQYATGSQGDEVVSQLEKIFITKTRDEWVEYLEDFEICHGSVNDFQETFSDPQVLHREMVLEVDHPTSSKLDFPLNSRKHPVGSGFHRPAMANTQKKSSESWDIPRGISNDSKNRG
jgi:crotonobetainyl-CoA:carnitine CoA-transferase CaiB-like acyl-CoA transferase